MTGSASYRAQIETLIAQSEAMEVTFERWQHESESPSREDLAAGHRAYQEWYARAVRFVPDDDLAEFKDLYEGGFFTQRIKAFLSDPLSVNPLYNADEENLFVDKWLHPFRSQFAQNHLQQRTILLRAAHAEAAVVTVLDDLTDLLRRLPDYLAVVRSYDNPSVPCPEIGDEADLQVVVHSMLRLKFDDVRREDLVSQYAGGGSRVDFLLAETGVVIETKMMRPTLNDTKVGAELLVDWGRYPRHPDCRAIFAMIYDPARRLLNPAGLTTSLSNTHLEVPTRAIVVS